MNLTREATPSLRLMLEAFPGGIAHLDRSLVFTYCNDVQASYFGRVPKSVIGHHLHSVVPDNSAFFRAIERVLETGESVSQSAVAVTWPERPEEGEHHFLNSYAPELDDAGWVIGVFMTAIEVTDTVLQETRIKTGLLARNKELEETIRERDLLIGIVSHELRNPLTTIFGHAHLLLRRLTDMDVGARTSAIRDIRQEADRLNKLVENMLLLARASSNALVPGEPFLVERVLGEALAEHHINFPERPIDGDVKPRDLVAEGQPEYVKQVVQNLLSNAEKYSPAGERIDLRARSYGDEVIITVFDRGPGVPADEKDIVFQPFFRSQHTSGKVRGAGIGLAVCKLLVQAQSGRIWLRPRRCGGSVFAFTLPKTAHDAGEG